MAEQTPTCVLPEDDTHGLRLAYMPNSSHKAALQTAAIQDVVMEEGYSCLHVAPTAKGTPLPEDAPGLHSVEIFDLEGKEVRAEDLMMLLPKVEAKFAELNHADAQKRRAEEAEYGRDLMKETYAELDAEVPFDAQQQKQFAQIARLGDEQMRQAHNVEALLSQHKQQDTFER